MNWEKVYELIDDLPKSEQFQLFQAMQSVLFPESKEDIAAMVGDIREVRFSSGHACVHCGSVTVKCNGKYRSRQRYLCRELRQDIQKSISWYKDILGLQPIWYSEQEKLAQMNLPSGPMLFLNETRDNTTANFTKNGEIHNILGFQTNNIEHLFNHLKEHNVHVEEIIDDGEGNKFLHFYDLDGNRFCVQFDNRD